MFDPYHKWLGIPPKDQPPNHYRLLGIDLFESDADVIDASANKQMAYIQGCATGPHIASSQRLLNEIAAARLCLLSSAKKADYDAKLKASLPSVPLAKPVLATHSVSPQQVAITADSPAPVLPKPPQDEPDLFDVLESEPDVGILKRKKHRSKNSLLILLGCAFLGVIGLVIVAVYSLGVLNPSKTDKRQVKDAKPLPHPEMLKTDKKGAASSAEQLKKRLSHIDLSTVEVLDDFVRLKPGTQMRTKESYSGPIEVVVIARTEKYNIRLHAFNGARLIFNWEQRWGEFRVHRPDTSLATARNQPLDPNIWYTLRWRITDQDMEVSVDGKIVFSEKREYNLSAKNPVEVVTIESVVDVKSLDVRPLKTPKQDGPAISPDKSKSDKKVEAVKNPEIHIIAEIDGCDTLQISETDGFWVHHSFAWPTSVKINSLDWNPKAKPKFAQAGTSQLFAGKIDFLTAKLSVKKGRGSVELKKEIDRIQIRFDDYAAGSDIYEVVVSFGK